MHKKKGQKVRERTKTEDNGKETGWVRKERKGERVQKERARTERVRVKGKKRMSGERKHSDRGKKEGVTVLRIRIRDPVPF
jgi:hypothetical protein